MEKVIVQTKPWYQSTTMIVNGTFFILSFYVELVQILTNGNVLTPIIGLFIHNPAEVAPLITVIVQLSSFINILLRLKTKSPVTA